MIAMKQIKLFFLCAAAAIAISSCKKDENRIVLQGGTAPVLSANRTGNISLSANDSTSEAIRLTWTNPNYSTTTGISASDVNYLIEIDTAGANFSRARKGTISVANDLGVSLTQGRLNAILAREMGFATGRQASFQMRVVASIAGTNTTSATRLVSNVLNFTATPFAPPPRVQPYTNLINGRDSVELFIVGNATPGGWNNPVPEPAQRFRQVTPTFYTVTLQMTQGGSYLLLPTNGDWSRKYGFDGTANNSNPQDQGLFRREGNDILMVGASGLYKIEVDFQEGTFKLIRQ
jgi:hypothetical protein